MWSHHPIYQGLISQALAQVKEIQESLSTTPRDPLLLQQKYELWLQYSDIISSSLSLMRQQSKMDWIGLGDTGSRLFFARAKQRKLSSYIYTLKNNEGSNVEGFDQVGKIMSKFYAQLLGTKVWQRTSIDPQASIFLLPNAVLDKLTKLCRNYLWAGTTEYKKAPNLSWSTTCLSKREGGIGIKDFKAWNKATIAKLICSIKKLFKHGYFSSRVRAWSEHTLYKVSNGYEWQMKTRRKVPWDKIIWARTVIPRHSSTTWMLAHGRLPTRVRLN
ncbi:hypothetical protein Cgig2_023879 [Carnegiea gigantea]|uniref:Reverse transcriptase zinc-binding domain-containing protein n=1 Tax=Carnegiea gigantea TaxID=171969 RepID=A0A9Q1JFA8_9CARY|nr:hypothetical protein Cgig2_023879 [Carnegiea gigantea]